MPHCRAGQLVPLVTEVKVQCPYSLALRGGQSLVDVDTCMSGVCVCVCVCVCVVCVCVCV